MSLDPGLQQQLANQLELYLSPNDASRSEALRFFNEFRAADSFQFIRYLVFHLGNLTTTPKSRALASIFLYDSLHKRDLDQQKEFAEQQWKSVDIQLREALRVAATQNLIQGEPDLQLQFGNLLGLFYAIENFPKDNESPFSAYGQAFGELYNLALNSPDPNLRLQIYNVFSSFSLNSIELNPSSAKDKSNKSPPFRFLEIYLTGIASGCVPLQKRAITCLTTTFPYFKRRFSFENQRTPLLNMIFALIQNGDPELLVPAYQLLKKCIDYCYNYMFEYMDKVEEITFADLQSESADRQIQACFIWSTIGECEYDIDIMLNAETMTDKVYKIKKKHREFSPNPDNVVFSKWAIDQLFDILVVLIVSTNPQETEAHTALELTPSYAAFTCIASLILATDLYSLPRIYQFVQQNAVSPDWRLRYTSVILLNPATQVRSFLKDRMNILTTYQLFVQAIVDEVPRVSEAAMWSLGRMIKEINTLPMDPERFVTLCTNVAQRMNVSDELTCRACWLLRECFAVFSRDDENSPLVQNFMKFAVLLMECVERYDGNAQDAAFGALNKLIECTPETIAVEYNKLFEIVTAKLAQIITVFKGSDRFPSKITQQIIGYLFLIQGIVMNVGAMISTISDQLMAMLIAVLDFQQANLITEVLPAMGAIARAIKEGFLKFLPSLLPKVFEFLSMTEFVQPAAVFVSDIYNGCPAFPEEMTNQFVKALFNCLTFDDLPIEAQIAVFIALAEIATSIGEKSLPWIQAFLGSIESVAASLLRKEDSTNQDSAGRKEENIRSFILQTIAIYSKIVPIFASVPRGFKTVRNFFNIFEKISKLEIPSDFCISDAVSLIRLITETFANSLNVYLNKPDVKNILLQAINSDDPNLAEFAQETYDIVISL